MPCSSLALIKAHGHRPVWDLRISLRILISRRSSLRLSSSPIRLSKAIAYLAIFSSQALNFVLEHFQIVLDPLG